MPALQTQRVACPECGEALTIDVPDGDVELEVTTSVALYGEHETLSCSAGHTVRVYFC